MSRRLLVLHATSPLGPDDVAKIVKTLEVDVTFVVWEPRVLGGEDALAALGELGEVVRAQDPAELVRLALGYAAGHRVDGVLASSELLLAEGAQVAEALGLPHHPVSSIPALTSKSAQRAALRAAGLPTPASAELRGPADIDAAVAAVPLPAVLKPVRGMGSMATFRVDDRDGLTATLDAGLRILRGEHGEPPVFQLEQFLGGDHPHPADQRLDDMVTVECLLWHGEIHHVVVADKPPIGPQFGDRGHVVPSSLPDDVRVDVVSMAERAIHAVGAVHGAVHVEIKLTAAGPRVIEVNGRNGFALPLALQPHGYDYLTDIARVALGDRPELPGLAGFSVVFRGYLPAAAGEVHAITGAERARMLPGVLFLIPLMGPGHRITAGKPGDGVAYLLGARARTLAALLDLIDKVTSLVRIDFQAKDS